MLINIPQKRQPAGPKRKTEGTYKYSVAEHLIAPISQSLPKIQLVPIICISDSGLKSLKNTICSYL